MNISNVFSPKDPDGEKWSREKLEKKGFWRGAGIATIIASTALLVTTTVSNNWIISLIVVWVPVIMAIKLKPETWITDRENNQTN